MRVLHEASGDPWFRVLFIDDDGRDAELMEYAMTLSGNHFRTYYFDDPREAVDYLHKRPPFEDAKRPHLIITDLNMPGMDGLEFLREARRTKLEHNPVVILSNSASPQDVKDAYQLGASLYIVKPPKLADLADIIAKVQSLYLDVVTVMEHDDTAHVPTQRG